MTSPDEPGGPPSLWNQVATINEHLKAINVNLQNQLDLALDAGDEGGHVAQAQDYATLIEDQTNALGELVAANAPVVEQTA